MATAGGAEKWFGCVFEGCIASSENEIERRPYHRNCGCAFHKSKGGCKKASPHSRQQISYPMRRARSENCLAMATMSQSSSPSSSSSPTSLIFKPERSTHLAVACKKDLGLE